MKLRTLSLILILIFSGCASALSTPEVATVTPNIVPRLDPSPTPSSSTLPLTCQVTDLKVYVNHAEGYCFAYPTRFTELDDAEAGGIRGPDLEKNPPSIFATFAVEVTSAAPDQTLREQAESYLKSFTDIDSATFTWTQVPVANETGLMVEPVPALGAWRFVFVLHKGNLFRLSYWPVDIDIARADVDELTQTTLGSFAFTK